MKRSNFERLQEIKNDIADLVSEIDHIMRADATRHQLDRAKAYWLTGLENALDSSNPYDTDMTKALKELDPGEDEQCDQCDESVENCVCPDCEDCGNSRLACDCDEEE